jgi:hypothetical protein
LRSLTSVGVLVVLVERVDFVLVAVVPLSASRAARGHGVVWWWADFDGVLVAAAGLVVAGVWGAAVVGHAAESLSDGLLAWEATASVKACWFVFRVATCHVASAGWCTIEERGCAETGRLGAMNVIASFGGVDNAGINLACAGECVESFFATAVESVKIDARVQRSRTSKSHVRRVGRESFHGSAAVFLDVTMRVASVERPVVVEDYVFVSHSNTRL